MGLDFTYYNQTTKDALIGVPDPPSSGFNGSHFLNVGEIKNSGLELLLTATPIYTRNLQWDATVAFSREQQRAGDVGRRAADRDLVRRVRHGAEAHPRLPHGWLLVARTWSVTPAATRCSRQRWCDAGVRCGCGSDRLRRRQAVRGSVAADA